MRHSSAPLLLCGCMADLRTDEGTMAHLARLGRSAVTPEQALSVASQIGARNYVELLTQILRMRQGRLPRSKKDPKKDSKKDSKEDSREDSKKDSIMEGTESHFIKCGSRNLHLRIC